MSDIEARARELLLSTCGGDDHDGCLAGIASCECVSDLAALLTTIAREAREAALREAAARAREFVETPWTKEHPAAGLTAALIVEALEALIPAKGAEHE